MRLSSIVQLRNTGRTQMRAGEPLSRRGRGARRIVECLLCVFAFAAALGVGAPAQAQFSLLACFYECKEGPTVRGVETWQEVTTLMLTNPASEQTNTNLSILDGNENTIAESVVFLSRFDLDEVNVCRSLEQARREGLISAAVPSAGLIIATNPNSQIKAWMKNVTGKFFKDVDEPFAGRVESVGKTECARVDPEALPVPPAAATTIQPICIENTDEGGQFCSDPG